jgi:hypothetical protein
VEAGGVKFPVETAESTLSFENLGKTLDVLAGEHVELRFLTLPTWPRDGHGEPLVQGVVSGCLSLYDGPPVPDKSQPGQVEPGELAYLVEVGTGKFAISSVDLVGASYSGGVLCWQVGPALYSLSTVEA